MPFCVLCLFPSRTRVDKCFDDVDNIKKKRKKSKRISFEFQFVHIFFSSEVNSPERCDGMFFFFIMLGENQFSYIYPDYFRMLHFWNSYFNKMKNEKYFIFHSVPKVRSSVLTFMYWRVDQFHNNIFHSSAHLKYKQIYVCFIWIDRQWFDHHNTEYGKFQRVWV